MLLYENTITKIFEKIKKTPFETQLYEDCFSLIRSSLEEDITQSCMLSSELRGSIRLRLRKKKTK